MITLTPYCTEADMQRFLSVRGVTAFVDDNEDGIEGVTPGDGELGAVDDCISRATTEITDYAQNWYVPAGLLQSPTINRWATVIATFYLCERRGSPVPESIANDYQRLMGAGGLLDQLRSGLYKLAGIPLRSTLIPAFSNLSIDRRYARNTVRVTKSNSSPETTSRPQDVASDLPNSYVY